MTFRRSRVAFSFAGAKRAFVAEMASRPARQFGQEKILYDKYHEAESARELKLPDFEKSPDTERPRLLLEALRPLKVLLVLDNLESLTKGERDQLFTFVKRLRPQKRRATLRAWHHRHRSCLPVSFAFVHEHAGYSDAAELGWLTAA